MYYFAANSISHHNSDLNQQELKMKNTALLSLMVGFSLYWLGVKKIYSHVVSRGTPHAQV